MIKVFEVSDLGKSIPVISEVFRIGPWCGSCFRKIEYNDGRVEVWMLIDEESEFDPQQYIGCEIESHGHPFRVWGWDEDLRMFKATLLDAWESRLDNYLTPAEVLMGLGLGG